MSRDFARVFCAQASVRFVVRTPTPVWRKALTRVAGPTYHEGMTPRLPIAAGAILLAGIAGITAGCEDASKKSVRAPVPAPMQAPAATKSATTAAAQKAAALPPLPLHSPGRVAPILTWPVHDAKEALVAQVEQRFASGQQNYKAGHLEAARKDFDDAVDALLQSGYDLDGDPKLSELFHRVVDTVYTYELQAFRAGDGFQEAPAVPAPIDEVAEMTFPVDPRLKERAEEAAKNISHDLPLTVNDEVLSFLNFFRTPRGRAIVETGLRRQGRYHEMISRVLREEGVPQDLIYLAQAESAFQPLALSRAGARGMWQFVAYRGHAVRIAAHLVDRRAAGSRESHARGGTTPARPIRTVRRLVSGHGRV